MAFNVIAEALNSVITKAGTFAQEFIDSFWNFFDNDYMSMDKNINRVADTQLSHNINADIPVGSEVLIFIPLALILGAINFGIGVWYAYLNRDAWDAYWEKEEQRLARIQKVLHKTPPQSSSSKEWSNDYDAIPLNDFAAGDNSDEEGRIAIDLTPRRRALLEKIAARLNWYQKNTTIFTDAINTHKEKYRNQQEKLDEIAPLEEALNKLNGKLNQCDEWSKITPVWDEAEIWPLSKPFGTKEPLPENISLIEDPADTNVTRSQEEEELKPLLQKLPSNQAEQTDEPSNWQTIKNKFLGFVENFSDSSIFAAAFAYAWGYWYVFFFTVWGLPEYSSFAAVPLEFGLFALICPAIYLIYKEYIAYKKSLVIDENTLTEAEKKELDEFVVELKRNKDIFLLVKEELEKVEVEVKAEELSATQQIKLLRLKKLKEILDKRAANNVQFRWGWVLIALVAAITVGAICGLPIVGAVFAGIGVFVGILVVVKLITNFIDKYATIERANLFKEAAKEILAHDVDNELMHEAENDCLVDRRNRKQWANKRKQALKEIEYLAACLKQEEQLEALSKKILANNDEEKIIEKTARAKAEAEKEEADRLERAKADMLELKASQLRRAKIYQAIAAGLDFLSGYMFACLLGFAIFDFLGNVFHVALLASAAPLTIPVLVCAIIVGAVGLLTASSHAYRTWGTHQKQNDAFEAQLDNKDYEKKKIALLQLTEQTKTLRDALKKRLEKNKTAFKQKPDDFAELNQLLNKPVKERPWTLRKFVKKLRNFVYVVTSISSVMLIARAVVTMGFLAAIPALAGGSLVIFAAVSNPLGIAILSIATALLLFRLARQLYLSVQHARALQKAEHIDFKLEKKKNEVEHLEKMDLLLDQAGISELNHNKANDGPSSPWANLWPRPSPAANGYTERKNEHTNGGVGKPLLHRTKGDNGYAKLKPYPAKNGHNDQTPFTNGVDRTALLKPKSFVKPDLTKSS